nr:hypothetical protein [uncultured Arsenicibacter sp.]
MKTLSSFSGLSWDEQIDSVWADGTLLMTRRVSGYWLHLYALESFFAEIWICQKGYEVCLVRGFIDTSELEPYLLQVNLNELVPYVS